MKKKRPITLIELLIVILLIGIIGGALAFNMKGSLDKGKLFKTEEGIRTIRDILYLEMAQTNDSAATVAGRWQDVVKASPLVSKADDLLKDGWGYTYKVVAKDEDIEVSSEGLMRHNDKKK